MAAPKIGDKVRHKWSGFVGWVHGTSQFITGCDRLLVNPRSMDKDGKVREGEWFDVQTLELVDEQEAPANAKGGGPDNMPSERQDDSRR